MPATMAQWGGAELTLLINDVDYSCYATEVIVTRAKNRVWDPSEAGSCDLRLTLVGGAVAASTGAVHEPVTVTIGYGSVSRRIFTGRVQYRRVEISVAGDTLALQCVDEFMHLARTNFRAHDTDSPVGSGEDVPTRIARWLTAAGSTTVAALDPSSYTCPATLIDGNTLLQIQATAYADGGDFFVAGDGTLTFKAWAWQTSADSPECVFSDRNLSGWVPYTTAVYADDLDEMQNNIYGTRRKLSPTDAPVTQNYGDIASIAEFGPQGDNADNLELADDGQVLTRITALGSVAAQLNPRFDSIVVNPALDPPLMWPQVIPITYSTLVACNRLMLDGTEVSRYGHIVGELWTLTANSAQVEYRCSGTGTWDVLRPPRGPFCIDYAPDGSIISCPGYPCDTTCPVVLKKCDGTVEASYPAGSLCTPGTVFPTSETCYVCFVCDGFSESCYDLRPETTDAILWLDAFDTVANREIEKKTGVNPYVAGETTGFAGTRFGVVPGGNDAIDATLEGGLVAAAHSTLVAAASFSDGWTVDFYLWLSTDLVPTTLLDIIDFDSVKIRIHGYTISGTPVTQMELVVVDVVSGIDTPHYLLGIADIPIGAWSHWRFVWELTTLELTVWLNGAIV